MLAGHWSYVAPVRVPRNAPQLPHWLVTPPGLLSSQLSRPALFPWNLNSLGLSLLHSLPILWASVLPPVLCSHGLPPYHLVLNPYSLLPFLTILNIRVLPMLPPVQKPHSLSPAVTSRRICAQAISFQLRPTSLCLGRESTPQDTLGIQPAPSTGTAPVIASSWNLFVTGLGIT